MGKAQPTVAFPTERAFVIQFRAETDRAGRVEHVVSGRSTRFHSAEDLLAFIARVLSTLDEPAAKNP